MWLQNVQNNYVFDNHLTRLANHIYIKGSCISTKLTCNYFDRGGSYATDVINTIKLDSAALPSDFGTSTNAADNEWASNFSTTDINYNWRFAGSWSDLSIRNYYYQGLDNSLNQLRPKPSQISLINSIALAGSSGCVPGLIILGGDEIDSENSEDLTKSGDGDSLEIIVENFDPAFDSSQTTSNFYEDMAFYNEISNLANLGELDSSLVEASIAGTIFGDIIELNSALAIGDTAKAAILNQALPHGNDLVDNMKIVNNCILKAILNNDDTLALQAIAYQRLMVGGPAVAGARNLLEIIVDETLLPEKNLKRIGVSSGWYCKIVPNPTEGVSVLSTNISDNCTINLYNNLGNLVWKKTAYLGNLEIDFTGLAKGLYQIMVTNSAGKMVKTSLVVH